MKILKEDNFKNTVESTEGVAVVQFTAAWCGPCRMLTPRLAELESDLSVSYYRVDVDSNPDLAAEFKIMSIPTLQWYKDGRLANTTVGVKSYPELKTLVETV